MSSTTPNHNLREYFKNTFLTTGIKKINGYGSIKTGFGNWDMAAPLAPGLIFIGATCGMGKTAFAMQTACQIAKSGHPVGYFAMEMRKDDLINRSLNCIASSVLPEEIDSTELGYLIEDKDSKVQPVIDEYERITPYLWIAEPTQLIDDHGNKIKYTATFFVNGIESYVKDTIKTTDEPPVVFIDYLQIIPSDKNSAKDGIDDTLMQLSSLQRQYNLIMIIISSVNRVSYKSPISMASFKESGNIEYFADLAVGLQPAILREMENNTTLTDSQKEAKVKEVENSKVKDMEVSILKYRCGQKVNLYFTFYADKFRFKPDYRNIDILMDVQRTPRNGLKELPEDAAKALEDRCNIKFINPEKPVNPPLVSE